MNRRGFCKVSASLAAASIWPVRGAYGTSAGSAIAAMSLDGDPIELKGTEISELAECLAGDLLMPGDAQYDSARRIWNSIHDKRPALVVQAATSRDVVNAVSFARDHHLLLAVKGGGHSWPGKSACEQGLMLDLSRLNQVEVDRNARTATVDGGALLQDLDTAALRNGLVTTAGVVSHTGVGGFTLGGGFGRLNRKYGLAIDNLIGAEIVTADGSLRRIDATDEADLFWAIRGGGGNFGVVTGFTYRLHPFDRNVLSGTIRWPVTQAREVFRFYADWYETLSDELYVSPSMGTFPNGEAFIGMEVVYAGNPTLGEKELSPLRSVRGALEDDIRLQDYRVLQTLADGTFAHGIRSYAKSGMALAFPDALADALVESFRPDPRLAFFTHTAGGVIRNVDERATAFPHRKPELMIAVAGAWTDPEDDELAIETLREWFGAIQPFTGGYYDNIEYDRADSEAQNYGPNYPQLQEVKKRYDPGNLFRLNNNIEPDGHAEVR